MRNLRQLRADGGPLGPYGSGHFTYEESDALLAIAEIAHELLGHDVQASDREFLDDVDEVLARLQVAIEKVNPFAIPNKYSEGQ